MLRQRMRPGLGGAVRCPCSFSLGRPLSGLYLRAAFLKNSDFVQQPALCFLLSGAGAPPFLGPRLQGSPASQRMPSPGSRGVTSAYMNSLRFFLRRWPPCTKRLRADFEKNRFFSFVGSRKPDLSYFVISKGKGLISQGGGKH